MEDLLAGSASFRSQEMAGTPDRDTQPGCESR